MRRLRNMTKRRRFIKKRLTCEKRLSPSTIITSAEACFLADIFPKRTQAFTKLVELQPKWHSGLLWSAKTKAYIERDSSQPGLARPMYERYVEVAEADTANPAKYAQGLVEAYDYLASDNYLRLKDSAATVSILRKKLMIVSDPAEKEKIQDQIKQILAKK
jgi:hypothetical protein